MLNTFDSGQLAGTAKMSPRNPSLGFGQRGRVLEHLRRDRAQPGPLPRVHAGRHRAVVGHDRDQVARRAGGDQQCPWHVTIEHDEGHRQRVREVVQPLRSTLIGIRPANHSNSISCTSTATHTSSMWRNRRRPMRLIRDPTTAPKRRRYRWRRRRSRDEHRRTGRASTGARSITGIGSAAGATAPAESAIHWRSSAIGIGLAIANPCARSHPSSPRRSHTSSDSTPSATTSSPSSWAISITLATISSSARRIDHVGREALVDLDPVGVQVAQREQRRVAGPEVVDRDPHTVLAQIVPVSSALRSGVGDDVALGDLELEPFGGNPSLSMAAITLAPNWRSCRLRAATFTHSFGHVRAERQSCPGRDRRIHLGERTDQVGLLRHGDEVAGRRSIRTRDGANG